MKPFLAKTLGPLTLCLIAACASEPPPAPAFPIKIVETKVILRDDANILAPMLGRKYAVQQGYEDTPVPRTADPYDDATIALEKQKAEFDKVARSSEAAAWTRDRITEQIGQQIDSQAKAASATGADARLSVEITKYG